jgi:predicted ester cyclase
MSQDNKALVHRLVDEAINQGNLDVVDELFAPNLAPIVRQESTRFLAAFPDYREEIVELVAEGDTVVGRFTCSGTHRGEWLGIAPTGRRFEQVAEVYWLRFKDGKVIDYWGLEDTAGRLQQLGVSLAA